MRHMGKALMALCMMAIAVGVVITALLKWPPRAAFFPVVIAIPVFFLAMAELLLNLFGKEEAAKKQAPVDFQFSENIDRALVIRRTSLVFIWIIGFFLMILFLGFPIAVPVIVFLYLRLQGRERWGITLLLTGLSWVFFYGLFVWVLNIPFEEGWALKGLRMLGIG